MRRNIKLILLFAIFVSGNIFFSTFSYCETSTDEASEKLIQGIRKFMQAMEELKEKKLLDEDGIPVNKKAYEKFQELHLSYTGIELKSSFEEYRKEVRRRQKVLRELKEKGLLETIEGVKILEKEKIYNKEAADAAIERLKFKEIYDLLSPKDLTLKKLEKAEKKLKDLIKSTKNEPENARAYFIAGLLHKDKCLLANKDRVRNKAKAEKYLKEALKLGYDEKDIAHSLNTLNDYFESPYIYFKDAKESKKYYFKGLTSLKSEKYDEAIKFFKKTIEIYPQFYQNYILLATAYLELGKFEEAVSSLKKALDYSFNVKSEVLIRKELANAYVLSGRKKEAEKEYRRILKLQPENEEVENVLEKKEEWNKWKEVAEYYRKAKESENKARKDKDRREEKDEYNKSVEYYKKILAINPKDKKAHFDLGVVYYILGKNTEAIKMFEKQIELYPEDDFHVFRAHNYSAECYYRLGKYEKAKEHWEVALKMSEGELYYVEVEKNIQKAEKKLKEKK